MNNDARPVLELHGLEKRYRRRAVLNGLNLSVRRGEIIGLLGPNGCGKTTTLRIAAGYSWPDAGHVRVSGQAFNPAVSSARATIGYLPERAPLYEAFRVQRYLSFVAAAKGIRGAARREAVARALDACDLQAVRSRVIAQLSKGFRQRVGLAQAILGEPDLLLLDEPTNGLDPVQILDARRLIRNAARDRAVIFSTHIMQEVEALCTRVVYLNDGVLVELSDPTDQIVHVIADVPAKDLNAVLNALRDARFSTLEPVVEPCGVDTMRVSLTVNTDRASAVTSVIVESCAVTRLSVSAKPLEQRLTEAISGQYSSSS